MEDIYIYPACKQSKGSNFESIWDWLYCNLRSLTYSHWSCIFWKWLLISEILQKIYYTNLSPTMLFRILNYKSVINSLRYLMLFKIIKYHLQRSFLHFTILKIGESGFICFTALAFPNTARKYNKKELYHLFIR